MNGRAIVIGVLAFSTLGVAGALPAAERPTAAAENQDARETKLVMLKLPAMV
jgi:hypothetical protein